MAVPCVRENPLVTVLRTLALFVLAAVAEIGGAWLVWQGVREHRGAGFVGAGIVALAAYGLVATLQPDANFGRILAAYGGIFVAGSLGWGVVADGLGTSGPPQSICVGCHAGAGSDSAHSGHDLVYTQVK